MSPDEQAIRVHLDGGRFRAGVAAGRWRLVSMTWPYVVIAVSAAERANGPVEFILRLEVAGYPHTAPTGSLWDLDSNTWLGADRRPKGPRVASVFRTDNWAGGATAMYAAWDRIALQSHADWAQKYPLLAWNPTRELSFVLDKVHELLNAHDYLGI